MRSILTYIITFWVGLGVSYTQPNLILNPSLEDIDFCSDLPIPNFQNIVGWKNYNKASPDYLNICHSNILTGVPYNLGGYQNPHWGDAYCGLSFANAPTGIMREAIQGTFTEPLTKGKKYCFEFYINLADRSDYSIHQLGILLLTQDSYKDSTHSGFSTDYYPLLISEITDTSKWLKIETKINIYTDGIRYFVISNFQNTSIVFEKFNPNPSNQYESAYYFFDDFALYDCGEADTLPDTVDTASINFPSVFTPNGDGINDVLHMDGLPPGSDLEVYNRWGDVVYKAYPYTEPWDGNKNGHPCPEGVYHYIVQLPDGQVVRKFVHVFR